MNSQNNPIGSPPDFEKLVWKCPCCEQNRTDKFIKVVTHDISRLYDSETGTMFINVKYCVDMPGCKEKAMDRSWVIKRFIPNYISLEK